MSEKSPKRVEGIVLDKDGSPITEMDNHSYQEENSTTFTRQWSGKSVNPLVLLLGATVALPLFLLFLCFLAVLFFVSALVGKRPAVKYYKRNP